jgi:hypothetical protein
MCEVLKRMKFEPIPLSDGWTFAKSLRPVESTTASGEGENS